MDQVLITLKVESFAGTNFLRFREFFGRLRNFIPVKS